MSTEKNITRSLEKNKILILEDNKTLTLDRNKFFQKHRIEKVIRISKEDYGFLLLDIKYLTHFNLQHANHKKGKVYALPLIVKRGYLTQQKEVLPILSFKNCLVAECIDVRNNIKYEDLTSGDFEHSFQNIKNVEDLKAAIIRRYKRSMLNLSIEEVLSLGVAITKLKILRTWEEHKNT